MIPALIGMVHLGPLPGAPRYAGDLDGIVSAAVKEADALATAGFDALMIENFGDVPFFADDVPKVTIAAMTRVAAAVHRHVDLPFGVNVLRNDGLGALAVAAASGATLVRINVLSGLMYTDQGPITGRAAEIARARDRLAPTVAILADVFVKHATPPPDLTLEQAAEDLVERGLADALIVSGTSTGRPVDPASLESARRAVGDTPLLVGSGASASNVAALLAVADGVIAGTSLKHEGVTTNPIDPNRAARFVAAAPPSLR